MPSGSPVAPPQGQGSGPYVSSSGGGIRTTLSPHPNRVQGLLELVGRIRKLDDDATNVRRERRSAIRQRHKGPGHSGPEERDDTEVKACVSCRRAKTKCFNADGGPCVRCTAADRECVYAPAKTRGRQADRTIQHVLDQMERELTGMMFDQNGQGGSHPVPTARRLNQADDDSAAYSALHNPLGVLASAAAQSTEIMMHGGQSGVYWNNIYSAKPEEDLTQDPVLRGLVTEDELDHLVTLFHQKLGPVFLHLDSQIYTTMFLRMNSPFLTTSIAAIAASFDPVSVLQGPQLLAHAHTLASKAFADGCKSLEIVQAFLVLVHFSPWPAKDWLEDRSWAYQGQAMRLVCELRFDLPPDRSMVGTYRHSRLFTEDEVDRILACRRRTYYLGCLSEISMATQSGRADTTSGHRLIHAPDMSFLRKDDSYRPTLAASVSMAHIFSRALHQWHGLDKNSSASEAEREQFVHRWRMDVLEWRKVHIGKLEVSGRYFHIMLLLLSLRIPGSSASTHELLREISELAVNLLVAVQRWREQMPIDSPGGLAYSSNLLIVQIAYGAALVHKLSRPLDTDRAAEVNARIAHIATILDEVAARRLHSGSFAGYYASQIRGLCGVATQAEPMAPLNINQAPTDPFDFSFLLDAPDVLNASIFSDPLLDFLTAPGNSWA